MEASRQILWNIGNSGFLDICSAITAASLVVGFSWRIQVWLRGSKEAPAGHLRVRLRTVLRAVSSQKGMIRGGVYLAMHRCLFYGMLLLFAGSVMVAIQMHLGLHYLRGATYLAFGLIVDLAGIAVLMGVALAVYKRYIVRPDRLESGARDALPLILITVVVVSGFLLKGLRIVATADPWAGWSPIGYTTALLLGIPFDRESAARFHQVVWYGHAAIAFALIALIPWTKLLHVLSVPLSIFSYYPVSARMAMSPDSTEAPRGARTVADCTRKQLIDADACIECGRCKKLCPIFQRGIRFAPVTLMKNLRTLMRRGRPDSALAGSVVDEAALWACTLCLSCEERCPVDGEHGSGIVAIRRGEFEQNRTPEFVASRFAENMAFIADKPECPAGPQAGFDVYLWPGCGENRVDQSDIIQGVERLLQKAGITSLVLEPPACCGNPIRRLGNETLFRRNAMLNIGYLETLENATVITCCPHCFNTLKNEYPPLGNGLKILHHSQYLAGLAAGRKLLPGKSAPLKAVYKDPCFLGRYNDEYSSSRTLLQSIDGFSLLEIKHSRQKSFCCGSGGGTIPPEAARETGRNLIRQALKEGAQAIVTGCPYCRENMKAAAEAESPGKPVAIVDVAEIFDEDEIA